MKHYPRTCKNGHVVAGPEDETVPRRTCRECQHDAKRRYRQTDHGRAMHAADNADWYERNRDRCIERAQAYQASTQGLITIAARELRKARDE